MSDRASAFQGVQIGLESLSAPGVAVAANKRLLSLDIVPSIQTANQEFGPSGGKYQTIVVNTQEWTQAPLSGIPSIKELPYIFACLFGDVTPTTPAGGSTARQWEFSARQFARDLGRTLTVETGDPDIYADRFTNGYISGYGMNLTRAEITHTGTLTGKLSTQNVYMTGNEVVTISKTGTISGGTFTATYSGQTAAGIPYNVTGAAFLAALIALSNIGPTDVVLLSNPATLLTAGDIIFKFADTLGNSNVTDLTVNTAGVTGGGTVTATVTQQGSAITDLDQIPLVADNTNIYLDDTAAAFGTSQLDRALTASWGITEKFGHFWTLDKRQTSFAGRIEKKPTAEAALQLGADSNGMGLLTPMRSGATKFLRIENVGDAIESNGSGGFIYNTFQADLAVKILSPGERADSEGLLAQPWNFRVVYDPTWFFAAKFRVITTLTAL